MTIPPSLPHTEGKGETRNRLVGLIGPVLGDTKETFIMPRTTSKAESVNASGKINSASEFFPSSLLSAWPMAGAASNMPRLVDGARRMSELQVEFAQFGAQQARKNVATLAAFATCRTLTDVLEIWRKTATDAVSDYADEAERILGRARQKAIAGPRAA